MNLRIRSANQSRGPQAWFATFTFFDASGAISSSQWEHLTAPIRKLWRRMIRRNA